MGKYVLIGSIVILVLFCVFLVIRLKNAERAAARSVERNTQIEAENNQILEANNKLKESNSSLMQVYQNLQFQNQEQERHLAAIKESVKTQDNILRSLSLSSENMRRGAEEQAKSIYEARVAALNQEYETKQKTLEDDLQKRSLLLIKKIEEEQNKLSDLEAKQLAYLEAEKRAEEMAAQKDYYRLVVEESDETEIKLLRNLQLQFIHKEAIDKLIWETYYKNPYDVLMSHLFDKNSKNCGIYKITNLENNQAYIGQSVDIKERFRQHIKSGLSSAPTPNKLYQQMKKYGPQNFTFEVLEIVDRSKLNERESYWIDFYKTKDYGMNSTKGNS